MPKKKLRPPTKTEANHLFETLLGPDDDLDVESARQIIEAHGLKSSELVSRFKSKLNEEARKLRLRGISVPPLLHNALQNLEASTMERPDPIAADPKAWLSGLLDGSLQPTQQQLAYSLRPRKLGERLSSKDQEILDSLNAEIEAEEKKN